MQGDDSIAGRLLSGAHNECTNSLPLAHEFVSILLVRLSIHEEELILPRLQIPTSQAADDR